MAIYVPQIIDNLNSTSTVDGLSANQGTARLRHLGYRRKSRLRFRLPEPVALSRNISEGRGAFPGA